MKKYVKAITAIILVGLSIMIAMSAVMKNPHIEKRNPEAPLVCLDAGHGGTEDVGAVSKDSKRYEKDDNLVLTLAVKAKLEEKNVDVLLTRKDDTEVRLAKRVKKANRSGVDMFVSLHRNSSEGSGNGVEIWINSKNGEPERLLATNILAELVNVGVQSNRGIKVGYRGNADSDYYINKYTDMTSCLVELGFITDQKDNSLFDENLDSYSEAIAQGIILSLEAKEQKK